MTLFTAPSAGETARKAWATSGVLRFWGRAVVALVGLRRPSFFAQWCLLGAPTCDSARTSAPRILCSDVSSLARRTLTCGILEAFRRIGRPRATH